MVGNGLQNLLSYPQWVRRVPPTFFQTAPWAQIASLLQAVRQRVLARQEAVHGGRCCHCYFQHAQACAAADACCVQARVEAGMCQG